MDTLSNAYVRMSRRRFWKSDSDADKRAAYATLYETLVTLSKLLAPSMPFLSEAIYRNLAANDEADTVHLATWPEVNECHRDVELVTEMRLMQRLISLGLAARMNAEVAGRPQPIGVRQPLEKIKFYVPTLKESLLSARTSSEEEKEGKENYKKIILEALNVRELETIYKEGGVESVLNQQYSIVPNPRILGKKLKKRFKSLKAKLDSAPQEQIASWVKELQAGKKISVRVDLDTVTISPDEVEVHSSLDIQKGFSFARDGGYFVLLDTRISENLALKGMARELVRRIQLMRQEADYRINDRIITRYCGGDKLRAAVVAHGDYIQRETLSEALEASDDFVSADATAEFAAGEQGWLRGEALRIGVWRKAKNQINEETLL